MKSWNAAGLFFSVLSQNSWFVLKWAQSILLFLRSIRTWFQVSDNWMCAQQITQQNFCNKTWFVCQSLKNIILTCTTFIFYFNIFSHAVSCTLGFRLFLFGEVYLIALLLSQLYWHHSETRVALFQYDVHVCYSHSAYLQVNLHVPSLALMKVRTMIQGECKSTGNREKGTTCCIVLPPYWTFFRICWDKETAFLDIEVYMIARWPS